MILFVEIAKFVARTVVVAVVVEELCKFAPEGGGIE